MLPLQSLEYQNLRDLVHTRTGLSIDENRRDELSRILESMAQTVRAPNLPALLTLLRQMPVTHPVWQQLISGVTIGETYFFRNKDQFRVLQDVVLPELIAQRRASGFKTLRLWSAGCATGEEPYSLAIQLRELLPDLETWSITILATDLNRASLDFAQRGLYRSHSFRMETREDVQEKWFKPHEKGFELDPSIRKLVTFAPLNLVSDDYPSFENGTFNLDLIMCRNVTIYFEAETTRHVVERFYQCLNPLGWLVVGHAEPMIGLYREFTPRNFEHAVLYQKSPTTPPPAPLPPLEVVPPRPKTAPLRPQPVEARPDYLRQAKAAADREDWETALHLLAQAEQHSDARMQPQVHYLRALVLSHQSNAEGALQSLRRAIYCDPNFALAHYALGELYEKRGSRKEAQRHWRLSQQAIAGLDPQARLPLDEDLTIEMFNDLLNFRLGTHPDGGS